MPEFTVTWVERLIEAIAEIACRHGAEGADGGQRSGLGVAQGVVVTVVVHVLSFEAARQANVLHKHVTRVGALTVAGMLVRPGQLADRLWSIDIASCGDAG